MIEGVVDVRVDVVVWMTVNLRLSEWRKGVFEPLFVVVIIYPVTFLKDECFGQSLEDEIHGVVEQFTTVILFLFGETTSVVWRPGLAWWAGDV